MPNLKRSEIEGRMPVEVRDRVAKGGLPTRKVDWYAGRQVPAKGAPDWEQSPDDIRSNTDIAARRRMRRRSTEGARVRSRIVNEFSAHCHAMASWMRRVAARSS